MIVLGGDAVDGGTHRRVVGDVQGQCPDPVAGEIS
jgi:hypothetical protein